MSGKKVESVKEENATSLARVASSTTPTTESRSIDIKPSGRGGRRPGRSRGGRAGGRSHGEHATSNGFEQRNVASTDLTGSARGRGRRSGRGRGHRQKPENKDYETKDATKISNEADGAARTQAHETELSMQSDDDSRLSSLPVLSSAHDSTTIVTKSVGHGSHIEGREDGLCGRGRGRGNMRDKSSGRHSGRGRISQNVSVSRDSQDNSNGGRTGRGRGRGRGGGRGKDKKVRDDDHKKADESKCEVGLIINGENNSIAPYVRDSSACHSDLRSDAEEIKLLVRNLDINVTNEASKQQETLGDQNTLAIFEKKDELKDVSNNDAIVVGTDENTEYQATSTPDCSPIPNKESSLPIQIIPHTTKFEKKSSRMGLPIVLLRHPPAQGGDSSRIVSQPSTELYNSEIDTAMTNLDQIMTNGIKLADDTLPPKAPRPKKGKKMSKAKGMKKSEDSDDIKAAPENKVIVSSVEALEQLPAQEVSITAQTQVRILRAASSNSLENKNDLAASKTVGISLESKSGRKKSKVLSTDEKINQKAARRFNNDVRTCVEQSDPDTMRSILHNRRNHKFALDASVLEIVMKAYVMAAMLDDALYCLRVCTIPGTLSLFQTERILQCLPQNLRSSNAYTAADMINALCIATAFDSAIVRTYFLRIVRGIALEFLEEATSARDRICSASCERLVRSAVCVVDARLKKGKKPTELIVIPGEQLGVFVSDAMENRGIQAGDAVSILPYAGPYPMSAESLDRNMIEATVVNTNPTVVRLQDKANAALYAMLTEEIEGNVYRIDKLANRMGFNRQLSAAVAFCSPIEDNSSGVRDVRRPCPQLIKAVTAMDENINKVMRQQSSGGSNAMSNGALTSTAALCAEAIPWNVDDEREDLDQDSIRTISRLALEKYGAFDNLNASQQLAVEGATTRRLTLVQGPPGTGKTMTALRILQHWARLAEADRKPGSEAAPILATSDSNIAVDNLVEGCAAVGLRVVRLGRPEAIRPELLRFCIDRPPPSYGNNSTDAGSSTTTSGAIGANHKERMKQLKNAQVVCCTCIGSGSDILDSLGPLERVLVDEATQATEPAVLVPLMRGCRQLVLVGDHCQLPPTVLSTRAEEEGHGVPLFSRMVACGVPPFMLDTQYRMHPCIAMFPSDLFYGGLLKNGVSAPERRPLAGFPWPREEFPVAFIPVKGIEMDDGVSKYNNEEANMACTAVNALLQGGQCAVSDIAVVTPYAAQARVIRRLTRQMMNSTGPPYIEVSSVDGFQGREKEAVVFSAVRSNDYGAIGFTSDWRRINVSFTRARRALIVIGNDQTLRRGDPDTWMPWLAWADAHGLNVEKPGIPRGRYDPEQLRRVRGGTTAAEMLKDVLARQQAQKKSAEQEQQRAVKNAAGHIIGGAEDDEMITSGGANQTVAVEQNLKLIQNTDGNWDDSDDEANTGHKPQHLSHSVSRTTLASGSSSADLRSDDTKDFLAADADAWDL